MVMVVYVIVRTGRVTTLSAARFAVVTTAALAQYHPTPQVARELCELLAQRHRLSEIGQKIADRRPSGHLRTPSFVCFVGTAPESNSAPFYSLDRREDVFSKTQRA